MLKKQHLEDLAHVCSALSTENDNMHTVPTINIDAEINNSKMVRQPHKVHTELLEHLRQPFKVYYFHK